MTTHIDHPATNPLAALLGWLFHPRAAEYSKPSAPAEPVNTAWGYQSPEQIADNAAWWNAHNPPTGGTLKSGAYVPTCDYQGPVPQNG